MANLHKSFLANSYHTDDYGVDGGGGGGAQMS